MYIMTSKEDGEFEDTKEVGNCKSKKDKQNNGQKKKVKRTNNDLHRKIMSTNMNFTKNWSELVCSIAYFSK